MTLDARSSQYRNYCTFRSSQRKLDRARIRSEQEPVPVSDPLLQCGWGLGTRLGPQTSPRFIIGGGPAINRAVSAWGEMVIVTRKTGIGIVLVVLFTALLSLTWKKTTVYGRGRDTKTPRPLLAKSPSINIHIALHTTTPNSVLATPPISTTTKRPMTVIERLTKQIERIPSRGSEDKRFSRIMYLVQTESCLPKHLNSANGIGDTNTCQCDVLVLSYKQQCNDAKPPEHVKYLFNSSASWNVGRNLLLEVARKRDQNYLYYILMDNDITLKVEGTKPQNPWRLFEKFLRELEPALAAIRIANAGINEMPHSPPPGYGWGFAKIYGIKTHPRGQIFR